MSSTPAPATPAQVGYSEHPPSLSENQRTSRKERPSMLEYFTSYAPMFSPGYFDILSYKRLFSAHSSIPVLITTKMTLVDGQGTGPGRGEGVIVSACLLESAHDRLRLRLSSSQPRLFGSQRITRRDSASSTHRAESARECHSLATAVTRWYTTVIPRGKVVRYERRGGKFNMVGGMDVSRESGRTRKRTNYT